ncbi:hypothetical protein SDC9_146832 [bioreactor metagenome]|uniref:Uncharacterized protein n=1 Tax=bioreactor metagenome TaxID=1076179 RepID=A0A645ECS2_9ZZZZ
MHREDGKLCPCQHQGIAEVGQRLDKKDEHGGGNAWNGKGQGDLAKDGEPIAAQIHGGILQGGTDRLKDAPQGDVSNREEGQHLGKEQAFRSIGAGILHAKQGGADKTISSKEHDHCQGPDERGTDDGNRCDQVEEPAAWDICPSQGVGKNIGYQGTQYGGGHTHP